MVTNTISVNGNPSGNVRSFIATFESNIDVAILGDTSARTTAIKQDLALLGLSYTQYSINDWNEPTPPYQAKYFDSGWFTHYDKIVLPWQDTLAAKDTENGGRGYFQKIGSSSNRIILEGFMSAGGTVQAHHGL